MKSSRKGLKKRGLRCYEVTGPRGTWIIERDRPWRFAVRKEGWPRAPGGKGKLQSMFFQVEPFKRLRDARAYAESEAGIKQTTEGDSFLAANNRLQPTPSHWQRIAREVAEAAGLDAAKLLDGYKGPAYVVARWTAWMRLRDANPLYSVAGIGRVSGFDHKSVIYGLSRLKEIGQ